ncbi:MAG: amidohydrolase family protein [Polyangiaceae bacterium]|nr:amidohydrolase family protein [Polyangiaceae bacterium]
MRSLMWAVPPVLVAAVAIGACEVETGDADSSSPLPVANSSNVGGGGGSQGTGGYPPASCEGPGPEIESAGTPDKILLKGTVLAPSGPLEGEVLIEGNAITCVAMTCSGEPGAAGATVIRTNGIISPGLIDGHNHIIFDIFNEDDWSPPQVYTNHDQWPNDDAYGAMVDAKQYLNGEMGSPADFGCEMLKYGEMKALIAGTTSVQGSPGTGKNCFGSMARSLDLEQNDLPDDHIRTSTPFPSMSTADSVCADFATGDTLAFVAHIGEGVDQVALDEFIDLGTVSTTPNCLYSSHTTIIHGAALGQPELMTMATAGMSLVWSPRSNVFLYGGGTDYTKTTDIPAALGLGINVALGPDWSIGGSQNMLDEMRFANVVDDEAFGNILDAQTIWKMATSNAAAAMGVTPFLGSLEVGKRADISVFCPSMDDPYESILASSPREVTAVFVDGRMLYGDESLQDAAPTGSTCEPLDVCTRPKVACIAETGGAADKLDQTLAQITMILGDAMTAYDTANGSSYSPIAPLVVCPGGG